MDVDTGAFYFIEVNPRIQVEHTVTEVVPGLDIVKAQIRIAEGGRVGNLAETGIPTQDHIRLNGHALQCRITTENPENNFMPDYGRVTAYRGAMGFGIRVDGGTAYSGAVVTRFYDPMLEKAIAWSPTPEETISRMLRVLREYRIRGVVTNLAFLEAVLSHPKFRDNEATTRFIDEAPDLLQLAKRGDRATKLLTWIADVTVNGHPETKGRPTPKSLAAGASGVHFRGEAQYGRRTGVGVLQSALDVAISTQKRSHAGAQVAIMRCKHLFGRCDRILDPSSDDLSRSFFRTPWAGGGINFMTEDDFNFLLELAKSGGSMDVPTSNALQHEAAVKDRVCLRGHTASHDSIPPYAARLVDDRQSRKGPGAD